MTDTLTSLCVDYAMAELRCEQIGDEYNQFIRIAKKRVVNGCYTDADMVTIDEISDRRYDAIEAKDLLWERLRPLLKEDR